MSNQYHTILPVAQLSDHPQNRVLFGNGVDAELRNSIESHGILTPLLVAQLSPSSYRIISGHRRKAVAVALEMADVPCVVRRDLTDPLDIDDAWLEANLQREMTNEQKARWYEYRKKVESEQAKKRQLSGLKQSEMSPLGQICPNGKNKGKTADLAAKEVGWSRNTANAARDTVAAIDKLESEGKTEAAEEVRAALNTKSVRAGKRKAQEVREDKRTSFNVAELEGKTDDPKRESIATIGLAVKSVSKALAKASQSHGRGPHYETIALAIAAIKAAVSKWEAGK